MLIAAFFIFLSLFSQDDFPEKNYFIQKYYMIQEGETTVSLIHFIDQDAIISYVTDDSVPYMIEKDIYFERDMADRSLNIFFLPLDRIDQTPMGGKLEITNRGLIIKKLPGYRLAGQKGSPNGVFCTNPEIGLIELKEISQREFEILKPVEYDELARANLRDDSLSSDRHNF
jgi:hypothetical protein